MFNLAQLAVELIPKGIKKTFDRLREVTKQARKTEKAKRDLAKQGRKVSNAFDRLQKKVDGVLGPFRKFKGLISGVGLAAVAAGLLAVGVGMGALGVKGLQTADTFEQLQIRLESLRGSAAAAEKDFEWIKQFAKDTPLELANVTTAFSTLVAFGLEPTDGTLQAIVDTASKVGDPMESLDTIVRGLGKSFSKGKLQAEEALMMLEKGVPVWRLLSQVLGQTEEEVQKLSEKGLIGRDAIKALILEMGSESVGAAIKQMTTLGGKWSNLQDVATEALAEIGSGAASEGAKQTLDELKGLLEDMIEDGTIADLSEQLGKVAQATATLTEATRKYLPVLKVMAIEFGKLDELSQFVEVVDSLVLGFFDLEDGTKKVLTAEQKLAKMVEKGIKAREKALVAENTKLKAQEATLIARLNIRLEEQEKLQEIEDEKQAAFEADVKRLDNELVLRKQNLDFHDQMIDKYGLEGMAIGGLNDKITAQIIATGHLANATIPVRDLSAEAAAQIQLMIDKLEAAAKKKLGIENLAGAFRGLGGQLTSINDMAIADGFLGALFGEEDSFLDSFTNAGRSSATAFIDAFVTKFGSASGLEGIMKDFSIKIESGEIDKETMDTISNFMGYTASILAAYQSRNVQLSPTERGMMGAQIGSAWGGWGALIGGIAGYIHGVIDRDRTTQIVQAGFREEGELQGPGGVDLPGGFRLGTFNLLGDEDFPWQEVIASMDESLQTAHEGFLSVFRTLGDIDLLMAAEISSFDLSRIEGEEWQSLLEDWIGEEIPQMVFAQMRDGLETGLARAGFTGPALDQIFAEAGRMTGQQLIDFMNTLAGAAVAINEAVAASDLDEIERVLGLSALESFAEGMTDIFGEIELLQASMLMSLSIEDQAIAAGQIADLIMGARQAELQMLAQIDAMQSAINASIASSIEDLTLGGLSGFGQQGFFSGSIGDLMDQFVEGMSPEDIATNTSEVLGDLSSFIDLWRDVDFEPGGPGLGLETLVGDTFDAMTGFPQHLEDLAETLGIELDPEETLRQFFIRAFQAIQGVSDEAFEGAADEVKDWAARLNEEANETADILFSLGSAAQRFAEGISDLPGLTGLDIFDVGEVGGRGPAGGGGGEGGHKEEGDERDRPISGSDLDRWVNFFSGGGKSGLLDPDAQASTMTAVVEQILGGTGAGGSGIIGTLQTVGQRNTDMLSQRIKEMTNQISQIVIQPPQVAVHFHGSMAALIDAIKPTIREEISRSSVRRSPVG